MNQIEKNPQLLEKSVLKCLQSNTVINWIQKIVAKHLENTLHQNIQKITKEELQKIFQCLSSPLSLPTQYDRNSDKNQESKAHNLFKNENMKGKFYKKSFNQEDCSYQNNSTKYETDNSHPCKKCGKQYIQSQCSKKTKESGMLKNKKQVKTQKKSHEPEQVILRKIKSTSKLPQKQKSYGKQTQKPTIQISKVKSADKLKSNANTKILKKSISSDQFSCFKSMHESANLDDSFFNPQKNVIKEQDLKKINKNKIVPQENNPLHSYICDEYPPKNMDKKIKKPNVIRVEPYKKKNDKVQGDYFVSIPPISHRGGPKQDNSNHQHSLSKKSQKQSGGKLSMNLLLTQDRLQTSFYSMTDQMLNNNNNYRLMNSQLNTSIQQDFLILNESNYSLNVNQQKLKNTVKFSKSNRDKLKILSNMVHLFNVCEEKERNSILDFIEKHQRLTEKEIIELWHEQV